MNNKKYSSNIIVANWKMHKSVKETTTFIENLKIHIVNTNIINRKIILAPPFTSLYSAVLASKNSGLEISAQNMYLKYQGPFTGEISGLMLHDIGCKYVILGHSERRHLFNETNKEINSKIKIALSLGLNIIYCIGEDSKIKKICNRFLFLKKQLFQGLKNLLSNDIKNIIIAYEPNWAINTGENAIPEDINKIQNFIRNEIYSMYYTIKPSELRIIYGGSINPQNVQKIMEISNIDGLLVGKASLDINSFLKIINF